MERNIEGKECSDCIRKWEGTDHFQFPWKYQCSLCNRKICDDHFARCEEWDCDRICCLDCIGTCETCDRKACFACEKTDETLGMPYCREHLATEIYHFLEYGDWKDETVKSIEESFPGLEVFVDERTFSIDGFL